MYIYNMCICDGFNRGICLGQEIKINEDWKAKIKVMDESWEQKFKEREAQLLRQHETAIQEKQLSIRAMEVQIGAKKQLIESLENQIQALRKSNQILEQNIAQSDNENQSLERKCADKQRRIVKLDEYLKELRQRLHSHDVQNQEHNINLDTLKQQLTKGVQDSLSQLPQLEDRLTTIQGYCQNMQDLDRKIEDWI
eukprot:TRINITY_DN9678_c0_g1_i1.p2 TRINITY_DN9678_c0_g1~~TRINITY_DN9678_c0_g1_i1.p2  ORF type:complete len:196 (+),score=18.15 TRINITY_DN9678_c0_g1_i1:231-818(+)